MDNKYETISYFFIISFLITIFLGSVFVTYNLFQLDTLSYILSIFGLIFLILYIINKVRVKKITKIEILLYLLFIISMLSIIDSYDIKTSIFGFNGRNEGLLMILTYYSLGLFCSTINSKYIIKSILNGITIIGILNVLYGLFQINLINISFIPIMDKWKYARGFLGNSNNFALLMSICYFISLGTLLYSNKNRQIIKYILIVIFSLGSIISGSMSVLLSIIITSIIIIIFRIKSKINKNSIIKLSVSFVLLLSFFTIFVLNNKNYKKELKLFAKESITIISTGKIDNSFGTGRVYIWKNIIKKSFEKPIFGIGIDNIPLAFDPPLIDVVSKLKVDKAHSDFLQRLVCEGYFSLIIYIVFLIGVIYENIKSKDELKKIIIISIIGYIICVSIGISVIRVAPIFWILIGLAISNYDRIKNK